MSRRFTIAFLVLALLGVAAIAAADPSRWTERERADLLEPWQLEAAPVTSPRPTPGRPAPPVGDAPHIDPGAPRPPTGTSTPLPEGVVGVDVVRCRQLVIGQPARAEHLRTLLRAGADLETARRSLGGIDAVERTRDYVLEDLEPEIRDEIATLEPGDWSRVRVAGGRAILFQLVSREPRDPATMPAFGAGLGPEETAKLQRLQRPRPAPKPVVRDETSDSEAAAVVQQVQPVYPPEATEAGTVTVKVMIGRADDVVDVLVESASHEIFKEPAIRAARLSTYRTSRRDGIPETSSVTMTFNFVAPEQPQQPGTNP